MPKTKIIAHRGASHESPENTIASIKRAIELRVDCVEIDVHLSKDHIPIVIHDDTVERTTSSQEKRPVADMILKEIKKLDAGSWYHSSFKGECVPTLKEVLALNFNGCSLMIEIKKSPYSSSLVAQRILEVVEEEKPSNSLIFGSFEPELLHAVQTLNPHSDLIYIVEEKSLINQFQGNRLAISEKLLAHDLTSQQKKNKEIWAFTIDTPKKAKEINTKEIAGIITNNPRLMKKIFAKEPFQRRQRGGEIQISLSEG